MAKVKTGIASKKYLIKQTESFRKVKRFLQAWAVHTIGFRPLRNQSELLFFSRCHEPLRKTNHIANNVLKVR